MISREDVDNLANLARLELDEAQKESLVKDLGSILGYFDQLKEAKIGNDEQGEPWLKNVLREDVSPTSGAVGGPTEASALVEAAPKHNDQYVRVKKIL